MLNDSDGVNLHIISLVLSYYHVVTESKENLWDWVSCDVSFP